MSSKFKILSKIFINTFIFFILTDIFFGNYIYKKFLRNDYFDRDTSMGKKHEIYHHDIKKNYKTHSAGWGKKKFSFCSDNYGFRNHCDVKYSNKFFDIGIIGDSQTEGLGIEFEDTFVNLIAKKKNKIKIANLAVASYSPAIYYSKIRHLIENGFNFKEIIVFIDLSDLHDDTVRYELSNHKIIGKDDDFTLENYSLSEKIKIFFSNNLKISNHIHNIFYKELLRLKVIEKPVPYFVENNFRSSWTYAYEKKWYNNKELKEVIENSIMNMEILHKYLDTKNIDLSVAVFPWPSTIKNDDENNLQVKTWKNFCKNKCKKFYNFMPPFFNEKRKIGYKNTYFKYFIYGDIHLNEEGHKLIADNFD